MFPFGFGSERQTALTLIAVSLAMTLMLVAPALLAALLEH